MWMLVHLLSMSDVLERTIMAVHMLFAPLTCLYHHHECNDWQLDNLRVINHNYFNDPVNSEPRTSQIKVKQ